MNTDTNTVELFYKKSQTNSAYKTDSQCWITMIEQAILIEDLEINSLTVDYGPYERGTKIIIEFKNASDAVLFKLKYQ